MTASPWSFDVETKSVLFEGQLYSRSGLSLLIQSRLDVGKFDVAAASRALEELQGFVAGLKTLSLELPRSLADSLEATSRRQNRPVSVVAREALAHYLGARAESAGVAPTASAGETTELMSIDALEAKLSEKLVPTPARTERCKAATASPRRVRSSAPPVAAQPTAPSSFGPDVTMFFSANVLEKRLVEREDSLSGARRAPSKEERLLAEIEARWFNGSPSASPSAPVRR